MTNSHKLWFSKALFLVLFVLAYFAARLPVIREPLGFEEGIFAAIMVNRNAGPDYGLAGRVDGQSFYESQSHPAGLYELLRLGGWLAYPLIQGPVHLDDKVITPRLRSITSLYQFFVWMALALVICFFAENIWPYVLLAAAALSPLAIRTSALLQTDTTSGVVFCGSAAILLYIAGRSSIMRARQILLYGFAGVIAGLGKQEWSFALLAALVGAVFLGFIAKRNSSQMPEYSAVLSVIIGLLIGNTASCLFDPSNYFASFPLMIRFSSASSYISTAGRLDLLKTRLPYLLTCFGLLAVSFMFLRTGKHSSFSKISLFLFGSILLLVYFAFTNSFQMRYFAPSLVVLAIAAIAAIPESLASAQSNLVKVVVVAILSSTIIFIPFFSPNRNIALEAVQQETLKSEPGTMLYLDCSAGWNKPGIDFIYNTMDYELAKTKALALGKELMRP